MNRNNVEQRTEDLFRDGLHCAEAVFQAVLEGAGAADVSPRVASAFGGGVGRSKLGMCGALSGGLMALGILRGRDDASQPWDETAELAEGLFLRFKADYGCTRCPAVLENLGPQDRMDKCIRLAGRTAGMVVEALSGAQGCEARPAKPCGCGCGELHTPVPTASAAPVPTAPVPPATPAPKSACGCK